MINPLDMTKEAGGGSYPEPPDLPEFTEEYCECCGRDEVNLVEIDGKPMCGKCRGKMYLREAPNTAWEYITSEKAAKKEFLMDFWFKSLSDEEKIDLILGAFIGKYVSFFDSPNRFREEGQKIIEDFVGQDYESLAEFVEREGLY